ncbi:MAG: N-6 DNA methylase [Chitinophagaceae bacterium]|nr:N-6 DNA methylase [Chitinophagaceae bacterium]
MSIHAIQNYHRELEKIIHYGGTKKETSIRNAFYQLLNEYAHSKELMLIAEISTKNKAGKLITPDGTIKDSIRNDWGYWESKDESDDINDEIRNKFEKGYPSDNILFEDSQTAVLYQHGEEVMRKNMQNEDDLHEILTKFLSYERPEVHDFREAIEKFKEDIPKVTVAIRDIIEKEQKTNTALQQAQESFLAMAKISINPDISADDVKEMMIQHILSADIFNTIFDEPHFHQENNIARELNKVIETFFTGNVRRQTLGQIKHYYDTINARAASIADHHEKQKFLKVVYENFYKGYNPKAADRLGIVYTPNEIVQFMIRSTDYLLHKHFGKTLGDKNVEILDPATGTGTFITDIIDYLPKAKLKHKYKNELHANEVAILPYYIANLNIEYTYKQKMGEYEQFDNLCFVDTLDNTGFHWVGKQGDLFGVTVENAQRIKRQNERRISVIIGNPPYNANQQNENDNNKNREYTAIDKRIKETFIKNSTAQKTKMYDMYSRFFRWAMDRLNDNGVIAFISNRSFIESRTFDGFRKIIQQDFDHAYIIDTKSDVRANPKIAGTTHNVFGIQTGVAVLFLVKSTHKQIKTDPCKIEYVAMDDFWKKEEKLAWFAEHEIKNIEFENVTPDKNNNWINISDNDWDSLITVCSKEVKNGVTSDAIFKSFSLGVATNRDEWVYDFSRQNLEDKIKYFSTFYNSEIERWNKSDRKEKLNDFVDRDIKWTSELESYLKRNIRIHYDEKKIRKASYRCFITSWFYFDKIIIHRPYQNESYFGIENIRLNKVIALNTNGREFNILATELIPNNHFNGDSQCVPLYKYSSDGVAEDNITDWAEEQFRNHYHGNLESQKKFVKDYCITNFGEYREGGNVLEFPSIQKNDIFHYVYAVLHNPDYRKKYELNLKREFPRIPFYENFYQWVKWGEQLMNLHIDYETVEPYPLQLKEIATKETPKAKLKAVKDIGVIILDDNTELHGIPPSAWDYKLGNRSALEWILDQYKEKKPSDPTIAEKFNTYKFADYKQQVIDLLKRVCTVSVETMKILHRMYQQHT